MNVLGITFFHLMSEVCFRDRDPAPPAPLVPPIDSIFARPFLGNPESLFLYGLKQDKLPDTEDLFLLFSSFFLS